MSIDRLILLIILIFAKMFCTSTRPCNVYNHCAYLHICHMSSATGCTVDALADSADYIPDGQIYNWGSGSSLCWRLCEDPRNGRHIQLTASRLIRTYPMMCQLLPQPCIRECVSLQKDLLDGIKVFLASSRFKYQI